VATIFLPVPDLRLLSFFKELIVEKALVEYELRTVKLSSGEASKDYSV